jgi:hypothetical protein
MWAIVFFNPVIAFTICIIPLALGEHQESLLAYLGHNWRFLVCLPYFNRCCFGTMWCCFNFVCRSFWFIKSYDIRPYITHLPLKQNKRGSNYRIIISFLILCVSVLFVTEGNLIALAGVYTFSFLAVMGLFGIGNLLLKFKRKTSKT